jgi:hypothetical protein
VEASLTIGRPSLEKRDTWGTPIVYSADQTMTCSILSRRSGHLALCHPSKRMWMRLADSTWGAWFITHCNCEYPAVVLSIPDGLQVLST